MDEFEQREFSAALDEFFEIAFAKAAKGEIPYEWIEARIETMRRIESEATNA